MIAAARYVPSRKQVLVFLEKRKKAVHHEADFRTIAIIVIDGKPQGMGEALDRLAFANELRQGVSDKGR